MRAVAVRELRIPPEVLEVPAPVPAAGEIRVRMQAAGVNPFDWKILDGILSPGRPHIFPLVAGVDGAGVVEDPGGGSGRFRPGDRIVGQFLHDPVGVGTYCESSAVPGSNAIARVPDGMDLRTAAAIPMAGMTALLSVDILDPQPGALVLLVGAAGGVGSFALPMIRNRGARVVATARGDAAEAVRHAGADEVLDPTDRAVPELVRSAHPDGVDGLLDLASDRVRFTANAALVREGGVAVTTTFSADPAALAPAGVRAINVDMHPSNELLQRILAEVVSGRVRPPPLTRIRLDEAPRALAESRAGRSRGKVVIDLG